MAGKKKVTEEVQDVQDITAVIEQPKVAEIVEYNPMVAELARVTEKYSNVVWDVTTASGFEDAKTARADVRAVRYAIQNAEKEVLKPYQDKVKQAQARVNDVKLFGEGLRERVLLIETPIDDKVKEEETRVKAEKDRLAEIARVRQEKIDTAIAAFRSVASTYAPLTAEEMAVKLEELKTTIILPEQFGDQEGEATIARDSAIENLTTLHTMARMREAESKRLAEQAEQMARQQKEIDELREKNRIADEERRADQERKDQAARDDLARQTEALEKQRRDMEAQADQQRRDQEELARLRAAAAAPVSMTAPIAVEQPVSVSSAPVEAILEEAKQAFGATEAEILPEAVFMHSNGGEFADAPNADDLIDVVGIAFDVDKETAAHWLRTVQF